MCRSLTVISRRVLEKSTSKCHSCFDNSWKYTLRLSIVNKWEWVCNCIPLVWLQSFLVLWQLWSVHTSSWLRKSQFWHIVQSLKSMKSARAIQVRSEPVWCFYETRSFSRLLWLVLVYPSKLSMSPRNLAHNWHLYCKWSIRCACGLILIWPHWFWFKVFLEIINTNELRGTTWENVSLERALDKSPMEVI